MRKRIIIIQKCKMVLGFVMVMLILITVIVSLVKKDGIVKALGGIGEAGYKNVRAEQMSEKAEYATVKPEELKKSEDNMMESNMIDVPYICQKKNYPTGCESVSAVMVLQYYGIEISGANFIDNYLAISDYYWDDEGLMHGPAPWEFFVGNPREVNGFGCYATVIEDAVERLCGKETVINTTGSDLDILCHQYLDHHQPILVWASMDMKPTRKGRTWILESGEEFTWIAGEHCLVLVGYDSEYYYFNDPLVGEKIAYEKETVEIRYAELGKQSLLISLGNLCS